MYLPPVVGSLSCRSLVTEVEFKHIKLSDIETGLLLKLLRESDSGWDDFSIWESEWKIFDKDVHDCPDGIGSSGFGNLLENQIVGFISWGPRRYPAYVIIGHNCVLPEFRNRGLGKHQITSALTKFQEDGFICAMVSTKWDPFFEHAWKMYESCGFVECAPYRNDGENMIYYSLELINHRPRL